MYSLKVKYQSFPEGFIQIPNPINSSSLIHFPFENLFADFSFTEQLL